MKRKNYILGIIMLAGLWTASGPGGIKTSQAQAAEPVPSQRAGIAAPSAPENPTGPVNPGVFKFNSRAQIDEAIGQTRNQISGIGQELVVLETYLYLMRDGLMKEKRVGALAQIRWIYEYNPIVDIQAVQVRIDGEPVVDRKDEPDRIDRQKELDLYRAAVVPGEHQVTVQISIRGRRRGWFSYFEKYQMELKLDQKMFFPEGKISVLAVSLLDQGGRYEIPKRFKVGLSLEPKEIGSR
ncbi:MAG: hypothetical protein PHE84_09870 [bacterium]|nr:hypothetical protein [bacterium]